VEFVNLMQTPHPDVDELVAVLSTHEIPHVPEE
jgi:hypothetical protein